MEGGLCKRCGFSFFKIMYNCFLLNSYLQSLFLVFIGKQHWLEHSDEFNLNNRQISKSPDSFSGDICYAF